MVLGPLMVGNDHLFGLGVHLAKNVPFQLTIIDSAGIFYPPRGPDGKWFLNITVPHLGQ